MRGAGGDAQAGVRSDWRQAIRDDDIDRLRALLDEGADVDALDRYGQTGLMIAAMRGCESAARFLIERGAALDRTAKYRLSALMLAVINGHVEIARMMVQAGADTELRGSGAPGFDGKTARDLAAARGHDELVALLDTARPPSDGPPG